MMVTCVWASGRCCGCCDTPTPFCNLFIRKSEPPGLCARLGYLAFSLASSAFTGLAFFSCPSCGDDKQTHKASRLLGGGRAADEADACFWRSRNVKNAVAPVKTSDESQRHKHTGDESDQPWLLPVSHLSVLPTLFHL